MACLREVWYILVVAVVVVFFKKKKQNNTVLVWVDFSSRCACGW